MIKTKNQSVYFLKISILRIKFYVVLSLRCLVSTITLALFHVKSTEVLQLISTNFEISKTSFNVFQKNFVPEVPGFHLRFRRAKSTIITLFS